MHLDEDVTEGGRFDRPGNDNTSRHVCGQPAEKLVACAASDDVDGAEGPPRHLFDLIEDLPVLAGETVEDGSQERGAVLRRPVGRRQGGRPVLLRSDLG